MVTGHGFSGALSLWLGLHQLVVSENKQRSNRNA
jgi:hypothetical protein